MPLPRPNHYLSKPQWLCMLMVLPLKLLTLFFWGQVLLLAAVRTHCTFYSSRLYGLYKTQKREATHFVEAHRVLSLGTRLSHQIYLQMNPGERIVWIYIIVDKKKSVNHTRRHEFHEFPTEMHVISFKMLTFTVPSTIHSKEDICIYMLQNCQKTDFPSALRS